MQYVYNIKHHAVMLYVHRVCMSRSAPGLSRYKIRTGS